MKSSQEIATSIKQLATEQGKPIKELVSECGLSKNALSSMQSGGYMPRLENICKIADYLGVSVDFLLGRDRKSPDEESIPIRTSEILRDQLRKLSDESLIMLRDYTRFLLWRQAQPEAEESIVDPDSEALQ